MQMMLEVRLARCHGELWFMKSFFVDPLRDCQKRSFLMVNYDSNGGLTLAMIGVLRDVEDPTA